MGWTHRVHKHDNPSSTRTVYTKIGDRWTCGCGTVFEVKSLHRKLTTGGGYILELEWAEL